MPVTGASSGIGATVARMAAATYDPPQRRNGSRDGMEAVAAQARAAGARAEPMRAGMADLDAAETLFPSFPRLDALPIDAGTVDSAAPVRHFEAARVTGMAAENRMSPILVGAQAARRMRAGGAIVDASSAAATCGAAGRYVDDAMTKGGTGVSCTGPAQEPVREGIRTDAFRAGTAGTGTTARAGHRAARLGPTVPVGRGGKAEEVAPAIPLRLSDAVPGDRHGARHVRRAVAAPPHRRFGDGNGARLPISAPRTAVSANRHAPDTPP